LKISILEIIKGIFRGGLGYKVLVWNDKENPNFTNYQMRGNFITKLSESIGGGGNIDFGADAIISSDGNDNLYSLILKCNVENGLLVTRENSLTLVVDEESFTFNLEPSLSNNQEFNNFGEHYLIEVHRFIVNRDFIKLIANSSDIEIIIRGEGRVIGGLLSKRNISRFNEFYRKYLDNSATKSTAWDK